MILTRRSRSLLALLLAIAAVMGSPAYSAQVPENGTPVTSLSNQLPPFFDTLQERTTISETSDPERDWY
jgi:hypothetical protein